jgi:glyoxylase-like metal-dependent hydrolase (beta-lactamase superfamily II)
MASSHAADTLRIFNPHPNIYAYYDGRTGQRYHSHDPNWLDDGAFTLGVASYSIISQDEALIFDAHITLHHAAAVLAHVHSLGATKIRLVYSHAHSDHIAGAQAYKAPIISSQETASRLAKNREKLREVSPPVDVALPERTFSGHLDLRVGDIDIRLHSFNIHTSDSIILWVPSLGVLLAGDTLEDTATFIAEPANLAIHQAELARMADTFPIRSILPAHGDPDRIANGGYDVSFIDATVRYLAAVTHGDEPAAWDKSLRDVVAEDVEKGSLVYYEQYEVVHRANVAAIKGLRRKEE